MKKKVNIFGKKISVFVIALFAVAIVSAALLQYFGVITGTAIISQGLLVDGKAMPESGLITETWESFTSLEEKTFVDAHNLDNQATVDAVLNLDKACSATTGDGCDDITTGYYALSDYSFQTIVGDQLVDVNVEDLGDSIKWTVDFPMEGPYNPSVMNGHLAVGLVIATDGEGQGPAFQIHNNDGTDASYPWGTWLMSPWGPTIDDGWMGWHSSYDNTLVTDLDWVSATGDKYYENNPDAIYIITIDKSELGEDFHWALNLAIGSGFSSEYYYYEQTSVPIGVTPSFDWGNPLVDTSVPNYVHAELMEELINPITVLAGDQLDFVIVNEFPKMMKPATYTITTTVNPAA